MAGRHLSAVVAACFVGTLVVAAAPIEARRAPFKRFRDHGILVGGRERSEPLDLPHALPHAACQPLG